MLMESLVVLTFLKKVVSVLWFFPSSSYFPLSVNQVRNRIRESLKKPDLWPQEFQLQRLACDILLKSLVRNRLEQIGSPWKGHCTKEPAGNVRRPPEESMRGGAEARSQGRAVKQKKNEARSPCLGAAGWRCPASDYSCALQEDLSALYLACLPPQLSPGWAADSVANRGREKLPGKTVRGTLVRLDFGLHRTGIPERRVRWCPTFAPSCCLERASWPQCREGDPGWAWQVPKAERTEGTSVRPRSLGLKGWVWEGETVTRRSSRAQMNADQCVCMWACVCAWKLPKDG